MAAVTNATRTTELTEVIDSEWISRRMDMEAATPMTAEQIVRLVNATTINSNVVTIPIGANQVGSAASITETDEAAMVVNEIDSEVNLTMANVGLSSFVSDQAQQLSIWRAWGLAVQNGVHSIRDKIDEDVLGLSTSITASIGDNATNNDLNNWNTILTTFETQNATPGLPLATVLHPDAFRDLHASILTTSAALLGSAFGEQARGQSQGHQGRKGMLDGVAFFTSDNIPADDTTGWGNILVTTPTSVGGEDGGALAVAVWKDIGGEKDRSPRRSGDELTTTAWYAVGIAKQTDALNYITQT